MGLRRIEYFNLALLSKWKWRILEEKDALWYRTLKARYGDLKLCVVHEEVITKGKTSISIWWANISTVGSQLHSDLFASAYRFKLGNGFFPSFWHSRWSDLGPLKDRFPLLHSISFFQEVAVALMGCWHNGSWTRSNFVLNPLSLLRADIAAKLVLLHNSLQLFAPDPASSDSVTWLLESEGRFTIKICYERLCYYQIPFSPSNRFYSAFVML